MNIRHRKTEKKNSHFLTKFSLLSLSLVSLCLFHITYASDATLFISPITATYTTGETVTLTVVVTSGGQSINAVEGKLEYDPKEVQVLSVDTSTSALTSWTITPTFANDIGEVSFAGLLSTSTVQIGRAHV